MVYCSTDESIFNAGPDQLFDPQRQIDRRFGRKSATSTQASTKKGVSPPSRIHPWRGRGANYKQKFEPPHIFSSNFKKWHAGSPASPKSQSSQQNWLTHYDGAHFLPFFRQPVSTTMFKPPLQPDNTTTMADTTTKQQQLLSFIDSQVNQAGPFGHSMLCWVPWASQPTRTFLATQSHRLPQTSNDFHPFWPFVPWYFQV